MKLPTSSTQTMYSCISPVNRYPMDPWLVSKFATDRWMRMICLICHHCSFLFPVVIAGSACVWDALMSFVNRFFVLFSLFYCFGYLH